MDVICVRPMSNDITVNFAAKELVKYLNKMGNVANFHSYSGNIKVGLYEDFNIKTEINHPFDDEVYINIHDDEGIISGPNPRSVLFAVYRYLNACGCQFLHPGTEGEVIPNYAPCVNYELREAPSYRHRGLAMEGSMSSGNLFDFIDWLPKVGMNSYYTQLKNGHTFFERWYSHKYNPHKAPEAHDYVDSDRYVEKAVGEIKRRGLIYQTMGHGLTCEPFGIQGLGWDKVTDDIPEETRLLLAEIDGKREFRRGIPVNTNACYSNPIARKKIVDYIVDYCREHSYVDLFHFWLADDVNNHCECESCVEKNPSDWYVMMLNDVDERLTEENIDMKIVFLLFYELLWPPEYEMLKNQDRFILLFAPLARKYNAPFEVTETVPLPEFTRNDIYVNENTNEDFSFLAAWKQMFKGDSFIFTYHLMTTGWEKDLAGYDLAKVIYDDIQQYKDFDLNGISACQTQRIFFPTGLTMHVFARAMWDTDLSFEQISNEYFLHAFGSDYKEVEQFISTMSGLFDVDYLQMALPRIDKDMAEKFANIPNYIASFSPVIKRNLTITNEAQRRQWRYLDIYSEVMKDCAYMFVEIAKGNRDDVREKYWPEFLEHFFKYEDILENVFDIEWFTRNFRLYQIEEGHFTNYDE